LGALELKNASRTPPAWGARWLPCVTLLMLACAHAEAERAAAGPGAGDSAQGGPALTPPPSATSPEPQPSSQEIPVDADDGVWGRALAPVTLVVFTDLQCPFCARGHESLVELERRYGEARLRVVIKHVPLANHPFAVPAARVAQAVLKLGGRGKFFEYLDRAFATPDEVAAGRVLELAQPLGLEMNRLRELADSADIGREVLGDALLADRLQVPATPHYRINGLPLTGVQPLSTFVRLVEEELAQTARLSASGVGAAELYSARVRENFGKAEP
jgi:protein-disulfide isomerase